ADHQRSSLPELDQCDAAQNQRAHDAFAELYSLDEERPYPFGRDEQRVDFSCRTAIDERCSAVPEHGELTEELSRSLVDHRRDVPETVARRNGDMPRENDVHPQPGFANLEERLPPPPTLHAPPQAERQ